MFPGETLTVYADPCYAYGVTQDFGRLWQQRGFKVADGKPISHQTLVSDLLQAITLPARLAIVRVKGHSSPGDTDVHGNNLADESAGWAAKEGPHSPHISKKPVYGMLCAAYTPSKIDLLLLQSEASDRDIQYWHDHGLDKPADDSLLYDSTGRIALPASTLPFLARHFQDVSHVGQRGVMMWHQQAFLHQKHG